MYLGFWYEEKIFLKVCFGNFFFSPFLSINQCNGKKFGGSTKKSKLKNYSAKWDNEKKSNWQVTPLSSFSLNLTKQTPQKDYTPLSSSILSNTANGVVSWVSLFCLKCDFSEEKGKFDCKHTSFDIWGFIPSGCETQNP